MYIKLLETCILRINFMQNKLRFNTTAIKLICLFIIRMFYMSQRIQDFFWLNAKLNQNDRNYLKSMKCDYCMFCLIGRRMLLKESAMWSWWTRCESVGGRWKSSPACIYQENVSIHTWYHTWYHTWFPVDM